MSARVFGVGVVLVAAALAARFVGTPAAPASIEPPAAASGVDPTPPTLALGAERSPHRLVVYSDYECAVCALLERETGAALRELADHGRLRVEIRHFPLPGHRRAPRAAAAAVCAERQGRGWAMHAALMASAPRWRSGPPAAPWFLQLADSLGLDRSPFGRCLEDPSVTGAIAADRALGRSIGLVGVPALFLDGRRIAFRTGRALVHRVRRAVG
jgi:protein-disulfide isomerase